MSSPPLLPGETPTALEYHAAFGDVLRNPRDPSNARVLAEYHALVRNEARAANPEIDFSADVSTGTVNGNVIPQLSGRGQQNK